MRSILLQPRLYCAHDGIYHIQISWTIFVKMLELAHRSRRYNLVAVGVKATTMEAFGNRVARLPLFLEAFCFLALAKAAVKVLPFTWIARHIAAPSEPVTGETNLEIVRRVRWAVRAAAARLAPWAVCLPQAIAGHWMLRRRGIASAVCFGVGRDSEAKLGAHAWLRTTDRIVLGEKAMPAYAPIAEFPAGLPGTYRP